MRKLYKLKKWYSLEDAATRLSLTLGEPVTVQDIRQLMADEHIAAYWNVHHLYAIEVAPVTSIYRAGDDVFELSKAMGTISESVTRIMSGGFERQADRVQTLDGVYKIDTENIGAAKHWLKALAAGRDSEYVSLEGAMLIGEDDKLWQLMAPFPERENSKKHTPWSNPNNFYPNFELPEEMQLVVSKLEIEKFEAQFTEEPNKEKPLKERERNTLLKLIQVLCAGQGLDLKQPYKDAETIKNEAEKAGISIDLETIANKLKEAKKS